MLWWSSFQILNKCNKISHLWAAFQELKLGAVPSKMKALLSFQMHQADSMCYLPESPSKRKIKRVRTYVLSPELTNPRYVIPNQWKDIQHSSTTVKCLHRQKEPHVFVKLDISKVFDSVSWAFMLKVLIKLGFGRDWRNLLSTCL